MTLFACFLPLSFCYFKGGVFSRAYIIYYIRAKRKEQRGKSKEQRDKAANKRAKTKLV